jgi:hypothetical protein
MTRRWLQILAMAFFVGQGGSFGVSVLEVLRVVRRQLIQFRGTWILPSGISVSVRLASL